MPTITRKKPRLMPRGVLKPVTPAFSSALPWLLGSVTLTMAALIGQVPAWSLLAFAACVGWRFVIERRRLTMPNFFARLLVFVPMTLAVLWTYGTHPTATGMLTFLVALMSLKVLELRSPRDFTVVGLLGYFMTLSAFFYNQSLLLSLYLGVSLLANTMALIRAHSGNGTGNVCTSFRLGMIMILQALPLVMLLFIIFPRVQGTFLRRLGGDPRGLTGMSEHLQPGSFSSLAQSTETAFRAKIIARGTPLTASQLYWRGLVMDVCEHALSWRSSEAGPAVESKGPLPTGTEPVEQQITLMPQSERWMFALDRPVEVRSGAELHAMVTSTSVLRSAAPLVSKVTYSVVSTLSAETTEEITVGKRKYYTKLPDDVSPRVIALAERWRTEANGKDEEIIRQALQFFRDGHFSYTLTPGLLPPKTALDTFLFGTRAGFCEHYAAAFSVLMRAAGLPARVVVGYQGGEFNSWGGHYLVRQSDAHAWSEVWLSGHGWTRADPTGMVAPDRVSFGADDYSTLLADGGMSEESRLDRLRRMRTFSTLRKLAHDAVLAWDGLDQQWNLLVLGYDQEQQWVFLSKLGVGDLSWLGGTTLTLVLAFTILALGTLSYRLFDRRGSPAFADRERRLYLEFCRRLAKAGVPVLASGEGPLDFARRAANALPLAAAEIRRITELYVALRYGRPSSSDALSEQAVRFRAAVSAFRPLPAETV